MRRVILDRAHSGPDGIDPETDRCKCPTGLDGECIHQVACRWNVQIPVYRFECQSCHRYAMSYEDHWTTLHPPARRKNTILVDPTKPFVIDERPSMLRRGGQTRSRPYTISEMETSDGGRGHGGLWQVQVVRPGLSCDSPL